MEIRESTMAGMFYPAEPGHLEHLLEMYFQASEGRLHPIGIVVPHAGYPYSGAVAARGYGTIDPAFSGTFIVIGPSHRGYRTCVSALPWETPLGLITNDERLSRALDLPVDEEAHQDNENSLETQMPFIKYRFPRARITPILMGDQSPEEADRVSGLILSALQKTKKEVIIVASSDFSHYIPRMEAEKLDSKVIEPILSLDSDEFYRRITTLGVSACGYGPVATMIRAAADLGAEKGILLSYMTSGDVTGDPDVVGYAAIAVV
ncbi:MAG: AmmeMemoRadiSam system protein B [Methanocalculus sp. MSAO_Arc1]|uniref:AmmeMemoRadiSam system protein B n=1 Tax=Methanocalculus TaxID=71151 RepID=UPI000FEF8D0C|nr:MULTISPECIES: AmmeMemoRadiSam system protein B [unclassified Methanocalculus]MCP1662249.1 AmmeMemoRadiSam system protein B [Methanocalculus sp. AMF5]RQD81703.1 MAG: AmmeMemoRadiSam system protein B [Methanocalculus sp. MSAO_Arc1]